VKNREHAEARGGAGQLRYHVENPGNGLREAKIRRASTSPAAGRARAPRRHCEQGQRRWQLTDGKDEGREGTATLIEHPRAEIAPNPVEFSLGSVFARNKVWLDYDS
jgi:hypothetical protein